MAKNYAYKARDSEGKIHKGTISAENERAVVNFIREKLFCNRNQRGQRTVLA